jgi:hypothetical protein
MREHILAAAGHHGPGHLLAALVPIFLVLVIFDAYCLTNLSHASSVRYLPKWVWALVILFVSAPGGGLLYLFVGRQPGRRPGGRSKVPG